jgi:VWFA-related protein
MRARCSAWRRPEPPDVSGARRAPHHLLAVPVVAAVLTAPGVEHVTRDLVLIEVHAVDADGRAVTGLTMADFTLRIDGRTRTEPIASLEEIGAVPATGAAGPAGAGEEGTAPRDASAAGDASATGGAAAFPRRTILFFEDSYSLPWFMTAAREAASKMLDAAQPGRAEFALASYDDRRGFRILHDFTADRDALRRTLAEDARDTTRVSGLESNQARRDAMSAADYNQMREIMAREDHHHLYQVVSDLRALVEGLAPWPGRKAIVYLGDGIPTDPGQLYEVVNPAFSLAADLNGLVAAATAAGVTLDAVQTSGIEASPGEERASSIRRTGLQSMTLDPGGRVFVTNDVKAALGAIETAAAHYYLLGYAPEGPPDGRGHTVSLAVSRRGVTLRYRRSFVRLTEEETRARLVRSAFLAPELHHGMGVDAAALPGPPSPDGRPFDLVVYVPAARVLFLPRPGGSRVASLEVGVSALDAMRHESLRVARRLDATLPPPARSGESVGAIDLAMRIRLPSGRHDVTVVVNDLGSGEIGATRVLVAEAAQGEAATVPGAAIYAADERALWIRLDTGAAPGPGVAVASRVGPALRTRFAPDEAALVGVWSAPGTGAAAVQDASAAAHPALRVAIRRGASLVRVAWLPPGRGAGVDGAAGTGGATESGGAADAGHAVPLDLAGLEEGEYTVGFEAPGAPAPPGNGPPRFPLRIHSTTHPSEVP